MNPLRRNSRCRIMRSQRVHLAPAAMRTNRHQILRPHQTIQRKRQALSKRADKDGKDRYELGNRCPKCADVITCKFCKQDNIPLKEIKECQDCEERGCEYRLEYGCSDCRGDAGLRCEDCGDCLDKLKCGAQVCEECCSEHGRGCDCEKEWNYGGFM